MAVAVAGVLCAIAAPSFGRLMASTALTSTQDELATSLHEARLHAVESQTTTLVCPSIDGRHCADTEHWDKGWVVAYDRDRDNEPDGAPITTGHAEAGTRVIGSVGRRHIRFQPDGSASGTNLSLTICLDAASESSASGIVVANSGRIRRTVPGMTEMARCRSH